MSTLYKKTGYRSHEPENLAEWLVAIEWSMGNGQCPECYGIDPDAGFDQHKPSEKGHKIGCFMAELLTKHGLSVVYVDPNRPLNGWVSPFADVEDKWNDFLWRDILDKYKDLRPENLSD